MITNKVFLETAFMAMLPGSHTVVTAFDGDPNEKDRGKSAANWRGWPWRTGMRAPDWWARRNAFYTVSSFEPCEEIDGRTGEIRERYRRRKDDFLQLHVAMLDDLGTKVPMAKVALPVSALIETSPRNYQGVYLLADDADSRDRATCERLIHRMIAAGLAIDSKDPGMAGVTRFARLPRGTNQKAKYIRALGRPAHVRLAEWNPERRYSIAEIAAAYGLDMKPDLPPKPAEPLTDEQMIRAGERFDALVEVFKLRGMYLGQPEGSKWIQVTCPWIDHHTDRADTGAALALPSPKNNWRGGFVCHHGHCNGRVMNGRRVDARTIKDVFEWVRSLPRRESQPSSEAVAA